MKFRIAIAREDIDRGIRSSPCGCPVALAICRETGLSSAWGEIDIDGDGVFVEGVRDFRRASDRLPKIARQFIDDFDAGRPVVPIEFPLTIRNWCLPARAKLTGATA